MDDLPEEGKRKASGRGSKVARLIDSYGLDEIGEELERGWTAIGDQHRSLRDLAAEFNQQLLRKAMEDARGRTVEGEVEIAYDVLTGSDVSQSERTRMERRLQREGVDVESLQQDFVSYQAIRSYLRGERDVEYEPSRQNPLERVEHDINNLVGRTEAVTRDKVEQLRNTGRLYIGDFSVFVDVTVVCSECNGRFKAGELVDAARCDCPPRTESEE